MPQIKVVYKSQKYGQAKNIQRYDRFLCKKQILLFRVKYVIIDTHFHYSNGDLLITSGLEGEGGLVEI